MPGAFRRPSPPPPPPPPPAPRPSHPSLPAPPFRLVDNEYSLLDLTDLVFIDPVSTAFRRAVVGEQAGEVHSFHNDIDSPGEFARL